MFAIAVTALLAAPSPVLEQSAAALCQLFNSTPPKPELIIAERVLKTMPAAAVAQVIDTMRLQHGGCTGYTWVSSAIQSGVVDLQFASAVVRTSFAVERDQPLALGGFWFEPARPRVETLRDVVRELGSLPGEVSFAIRDVNSAAAIAEYESGRVLALGSAFKLYVLGALATAIMNGTLTWDTVTRLAAEDKSLPSGMLQDWPVGTPLTIQTLAQLMIARSDNTATDALMHRLGSDAVNQARRDQGSHESRKFWTTAELFKVKGESEKPRLVDTVEWFASANDMCRALAWLHVAGESVPELEPILAVNKGAVKPAENSVRYIGYKGGSENGVLSLNYLAQTRAGTWLTLSFIWNDTEHLLDDGQLIWLAQRSIELVATL
jgi:hypothetical protein